MNPLDMAFKIERCLKDFPDLEYPALHREFLQQVATALQQAEPVGWLRDLLINTATTAVAAERQGRYPGAARVADWLLEEHPQQAEPVVEAHRVLVVESLPTALIAANWRETKDAGDEDIAAKLRRLHRLEKVVEAIESGESFEGLEKLAAEFRKGLK
jgi:hypothetical protein